MAGSTLWLPQLLPTRYPPGKVLAFPRESPRPSLNVQRSKSDKAQTLTSRRVCLFSLHLQTWGVWWCGGYVCVCVVAGHSQPAGKDLGEEGASQRSHFTHLLDSMPLIPPARQGCPLHFANPAGGHLVSSLEVMKSPLLQSPGLLNPSPRPSPTNESQLLWAGLRV